MANALQPLRCVYYEPQSTKPDWCYSPEHWTWFLQIKDLSPLRVHPNKLLSQASERGVRSTSMEELFTWAQAQVEIQHLDQPQEQNLKLLLFPSTSTYRHM